MKSVLPRIRKHILLDIQPKTEDYSRHDRGFDPSKGKPAPRKDRQGHGKKLRNELKLIAERAQKRQKDADKIRERLGLPTPGLFITFTARPSDRLKLESLSNKRSGIELLKVDRIGAAELERALVFVPDSKLKVFLQKFKTYSEDEKSNAALIDPIESIGLATLQALWSDTPESYPKQDNEVWWEVWLRVDDGEEVSRFQSFAKDQQLTMAKRVLRFEERTVVLVKARAATLAGQVPFYV